MAETMNVDEWPSPPLRNSSSPGFDSSIVVDLQPSSSDASSTTTLATTTTTTTSSASEDTSSSLRTTPDIGDGEGDSDKYQEALELTAQVSKQIETEAAEVQNTVATDVPTSTTRRRSMRIKAKETVQATAITTEPPTTPQPKPKPNAQPSTPATSKDTTTSNAPTNTARSLRSSALKEVRQPEPATESVSTRRTSKRISAINAKFLLETPAVKATKRAHDVMVTASKSAKSAKKTKLEVGDAVSSTRSSEAPSAVSDEPAVPRIKRKKTWLTRGLYFVAPKGKKAKGKKQPGSEQPDTILPLPMPPGIAIMETERCFKLPYSVFAPSLLKCPQPQDWRKLNHNQLIGDAQQIWRKEKPSNVKCVCTGDCSDRCLNRCTWVECTDSTCDAGRGCRNRSFADLHDRVKMDTRFAIGVEVALTSDRGYGLRALRSFEPGQIIVEYTGEIITQEESERRMEEVYKDNTNYYLMMFDQNMILDATRGSIARFVNHSCDPNCTMEKWVVEGKPRMALFAGDNGVEAGDELTYDYNFTWFKGVTQLACKCASDKCRGILGRRGDRKDATPPKKTKTKAKAKAKKKKKAAKSAKKRMQKSVVISPAKPKKRKPPFPRRLASPPPPPPSMTATPELEPPPVQISDDDSDVEDIAPLPKVNSPIKPLVKTTRARTRVMKTYKVNKTIAKSSISKTVTSESAVTAFKTMALDHALAEASAEREGTPNLIATMTSRRSLALITDDTTSAAADEEVLRQGMSIDELLNGVGGVAAEMGSTIAVSA